MTHVYLARFTIINLCALALLAFAWSHGWLHMVVESDPSRLTSVIAGVFLLGWALCLIRLVGLETLRRGDRPARRWHADILTTELNGRLAPVRHIANSLTLLGLIGTVVGFIIAFNEIDVSAIGSADNASSVIGKLLKGVGVALYTTLVGALAHIWLYALYKEAEQAARATYRHLMDRRIDARSMPVARQRLMMS